MSERKILFASGNLGKLNQIFKLSEKIGVGITFLEELGIEVEEPQETGDTLEENARLKCVYYRRFANEYVVTDDSGIFINSLKGFGGVYSSRYKGWYSKEELNQMRMSGEEKINEIELQSRVLDLLKDKNDRRASFRTVMALSDLDGEINYFEGVLEGEICSSPVGKIVDNLPFSNLFRIDDGIMLGDLITDQSVLDDNSFLTHRERALLNVINFLSTTF